MSDNIYKYGIYDGGGFFWNIGADCSDLYFVRKPVRPEGLKIGCRYRLRMERVGKSPVFYVDTECVKAKP